MPSSPKPQTEKSCPNLALAPVSHPHTQLTVVQLVSAAPAAIVVPMTVERPVQPEIVPDTGPPVLYLLNSVLLV